MQKWPMAGHVRAYSCGAIMNLHYTLAIGSFILAGAHYMRNGSDDIFYIVWVAIAVILAMSGRAAKV